MQVFACPNCQNRLIRTAAMGAGDVIPCPRCRQSVVVPNAAGEVPLVPQERPHHLLTSRAERDTGSTGIVTNPAQETAQLIELRKALEGQPVNPLRWWVLAFAGYPRFVIPMVALLLLLLVGQLAILYGTPALMLPPTQFLFQVLVVTPLTFGTFIAALKVLRWERWGFLDFFRGFGHLDKALGFVLLVVVISFALAIPFILFVGIGSAMAGGPRENLVFVVVGGICTGGFFLWVLIRFLLFVPYLMVDRGLGVVESLSGNWWLTEGKFWYLLLFIVVLAVVALGGAALLLLVLSLLFPRLAEPGIPRFLVGNTVPILLAPLQTLFITAVYLSSLDSARKQQGDVDLKTETGT